MPRPFSPPSQEPEEPSRPPLVFDPDHERLANLAGSLGDDPRASLEKVCRHVLVERCYSESTRKVFAEMLEQLRSALGQGGLR